MVVDVHTYKTLDHASRLGTQVQQKLANLEASFVFLHSIDPLTFGDAGSSRIWHSRRRRSLMRI